MMGADTIQIAGHTIGPGARCFLIAEAGVNHNGDGTTARRLIEAAAAAGVDAVKFQTFRAADLVTSVAPRAPYQIRNTGSQQPQRSLLAELELSESVFEGLRRDCEDHGLVFLSTPHTPRAAEFLNPLVPGFKVGSGDLTNLPFLAQLAGYQKPLILSTGMASLEEVTTAVETVHRAGNRSVVVLHCTTSYPCAFADVNLSALVSLRERLPCPVGYSDHTLGIQVSIMAATLGAVCLEKHFTLDCDLPGPDHAASLDPGELKSWVAAIRQVPVIQGHGEKEPTDAERALRESIRKSLVAADDIATGEILTEDRIAIKRPGTGLPPAALNRVLGRRARVDIPSDTLIQWEQMEDA